MSVFKDSSAQTYNLTGLNILIAEDSPSMQTLMASMLRAFGVEDILVCNGAREAQGLIAISQARKKTTDIKAIDIILTDWLMTDGSGLELIDWIRNHNDDSIRFLPIILVSAYTTEKVITAARDHGAHDALVKPVSGEKLAQRILSLIDNQRPFIQCDTYFGPDRRRRVEPYKGQERRVTSADFVTVKQEKV